MILGKYQYIFTMFTPTFNRVHTLYRVYESLTKQTFKLKNGFEWLIVDDGSTDETKELIENYKKDAWFPIRYYYQKNSGKYIAINRGIELAKGEFFLIADSDDRFLDNALEILYSTWEGIKNKNEFSAVEGHCIDPNTGKIIGTKYPKDIFDSNTLELNYKYKIKGEKWGFQKTDILKEYPFPILKNTKFIPEGIVWLKIARKYKKRCINKVLRIHILENDGITRNLNNFSSGRLEYYIFNINKNTDYLIYSLRDFVANFVNLGRMPQSYNKFHR